ncbi:hypothetical protein SAMN04489710_12911 [Paracidovorax konjaci]|uniref:Uncharacterized protein n=1 Tax=Paracidovorax konjaci TaxID=32040 RepID=A0A1I1ZP55_9BURK|nr:hypothetical protein SAMN04489710_12911 [Paracidovorax konjaci]
MAHLYLEWILYFGSSFLKFYLPDSFLGNLSDIIFFMWLAAWAPWSIALGYAFIGLDLALWTSIANSLFFTCLYWLYLRRTSFKP